MLKTDKIEYPPKLKAMLKRALENPEGFWGEIAGELHWFRLWDEWNPLDFTWFKGGVTNLAYNCLDLNLEKGRGSHTAIIWESGEDSPTRIITYDQLHREVEKFAGALKSLAVNRRT